MALTSDELIGGLQAAATRAVASSDAASVALARTYSAHPELQHFPTPYTRLVSIDVTLPFALGSLPAPPLLGNRIQALVSLARDTSASPILRGWTEPPLALDALADRAEPALAAKLATLLAPALRIGAPQPAAEIVSTIAQHLIDVATQAHRRLGPLGRLFRRPRIGVEALRRSLSEQLLGPISDLLLQAPDAATLQPEPPSLIVIAEDLARVPSAAVGVLTLHLQVERLPRPAPESGPPAQKNGL